MVPFVYICIGTVLQKKYDANLQHVPKVWPHRLLSWLIEVDVCRLTKVYCDYKTTSSEMGQ